MKLAPDCEISWSSAMLTFPPHSTCLCWLFIRPIAVLIRHDVYRWIIHVNSPPPVQSTHGESTISHIDTFHLITDSLWWLFTHGYLYKTLFCCSRSVCFVRRKVLFIETHCFVCFVLDNKRNVALSVRILIIQL